MRNWSAWTRAHPMVLDGIAAALLFAAFVVTAPNAPGLPWPALVLIGALACGPVAVRRRTPALATSAILAGVAGTALVLGTKLQYTPGQVAAFLVLYGLITTGKRRLGAVLALALNLIVLAALLTVGPLPRPEPFVAVLWGTSFYLLATALVWAFGEFIAARRAHLREVEERLRRAESERDRQARLAVAEERNRIAREIHDVLAHSLTVMIAQSDGATYALRTDPEQAVRATRAIGATGRTALAELRGLLDVLRDPVEEGQRAPQPAAASLRELVDGVRRPDLPVRLELTGNVEDLPTGLGLAVHRIVQEALTNVLKHGGGAAVVRVAGDDGAVTLDIADDGKTGTTGTDSGSVDVISAGGGLAGMWERAALYGGTLTAGPRPEGGWRVRAVLPLPHSDAA